MSTNRYGQSDFSRAALAPGLLGGIILLAGLALIGSAWFTFVQYAASILALILCVFAGQARSWWWYAGLIPIAIVWNPVWPLTIDDLLLRILHIVGTVVFVGAGLGIRVPLAQRK
jgi:hypothetical protein